MASERNNGWENNSEIYTPGQVGSILTDCGINVVSETSTVYLANCPYHFNSDTPAFAVNKYDGTFICFNPGCGETGNIHKLLCDIHGLNKFAARRFISGHRTEQTWEEIEVVREEFAEFPQEIVDHFAEDLWNHPEAVEYLQAARHLKKETIEKFHLGYDANKKMITTPVHAPDGQLVGMVGRSLTSKFVKNSKNLPVKDLLFNLHRAKAHDTAIVVEGTFDAASVDQAGYPNVVGTLGPIGQNKLRLLGKYFSTIIIMTDNDDPDIYNPCNKCIKLGWTTCQGHYPGRVMGQKIATELNHKRIFWAVYDRETIYPNAKDPNEMTDDQIQQCLRNCIDTFEYREWFQWRD